MKAHETVMRWVTGELEAGRLRIGDALPGERALAETLGVSRSSLREALRVLEALGTIRSSTGSGPTSGTIITAAPEQALTLALTLQLATRHVAHHDIYEVRLLLETWAAENATNEAAVWAEAEHSLVAMEKPGIAIDEFLSLDASFHATLTQAADNPLISTLMSALRVSIVDHTLKRAQGIADWSATSARLCSEHREILERARTGNRAGTSALLRQHITEYYFETEASYSPGSH